MCDQMKLDGYRRRAFVFTICDGLLGVETVDSKDPSQLVKLYTKTLCRASSAHLAQRKLDKQGQARDKALTFPAFR